MARREQLARPASWLAKLHIGLRPKPGKDQVRGTHTKSGAPWGPTSH